MNLLKLNKLIQLFQKNNELIGQKSDIYEGKNKHICKLLYEGGKKLVETCNVRSFQRETNEKIKHFDN